MPHPCCGRNLRSVTKLIAIIDIVWTSIFIALAIVIVIMTAADLVKQETIPGNVTSAGIKPGGDVEDEDITKIALGGLIVGTIILVVKILQLIMAIFLLQGAMENNPYKCKIWIYITCVFVIITVMNFLFDIISVAGSKTGSYSSVIGIVLHVYFLWIVYAFKQQLEREMRQSQVDGSKA